MTTHLRSAALLSGTKAGISTGKRKSSPGEADSEAKRPRTSGRMQAKNTSTSVLPKNSTKQSSRGPKQAKTSPILTKTSPNPTKTSPKSNRSSPKSAKSSAKSAKTSPKSKRSSPKSAKSSVKSAKTSPKPDISSSEQQTRADMTQTKLTQTPPGDTSDDPETLPRKYIGALYWERHKFLRKPRLVFGKWGLDKLPGQFSQPRAVVMCGESGDMLVADNAGRRVCVHDGTGSYKSSFNVPGGPTDMCIMSDGDLAVTCGDHKVRIYTMSGALKHVIGKKGKQPGTFGDPAGICTDESGLLYICDRDNHRVQVLNKSGSVVRVLGEGGAGKLEDPWSVAIHKERQHIFVADMDKEQVIIYDKNGDYIASLCAGDFDEPGLTSFGPKYVSCSVDGTLCISDSSNHCIYVLRDNDMYQRVGVRGTKPGEFHYPHGTALTKDGQLVVCDSWNNRIQVFTTKKP